MRHGYRPREFCDRDPRIKRVMDAFRSNLFSSDQPALFAWLEDTILDEHDSFVHLADLGSYLEEQNRVAQAFQNPGEWARMAILNVARMGRFAADRAIAEYARDIWGIGPVPCIQQSAPLPPRPH